VPHHSLGPTGAPDPGVPGVDDPTAGTADETPVFVDPTGARHRRARAVLVAASLLCVGFVALVVLGLTGSGPLSGSPIISPVRGALDGLGIPHPSASATSQTPTPASSSSATPGATTGGARPTTAATTGSTGRTPSASPTASTSPRPTTTPTGASPSAANPGATRRATPTPKSTVPSTRPSPSTTPPGR
jgi:hypothetical protein